MDDLGQFLFLAAGSIGLFTFLSVAHWVNASTAERQARERLALLKKVAEGPTESATLVLDLLKAENLRAHEREHRQEWQTRRNGMQIGSIIVAFGLGLSLTLAIAASRRAWAMGIIPVLIGLVIVAFASTRRTAPPCIGNDPH